MPRLTTVFHRGQGGREAVWERGVLRVEVYWWIDERMEIRKEKERRQQGCPRLWSVGQAWRGWICLALTGTVFVLVPPQLGWWLLLLGLLGSFILALRSRLELRACLLAMWSTVGPTPCPPGPLAPRPTEGPLPLAWALADSLVLCVLQEPLLEPSLPLIQALMYRLKAVSLSLERTGIQTESWSEGGSEERRDRKEVDPALMDRLRHISVYLEQRAGRLQSLLQVQGHYEARVSELQGGLEQLWARLEELHTRVTLTKGGTEGHEDLHTAMTASQSMSVELDQNRRRLQSCQTQLKESTMILQELAWSHTHTGHCLSTSIESVWPEVLLQYNIEQFEDVQESFLSLEQQTSTFQAHLEGLRGTREQGGPLSALSQPTPPPSSSSSFHHGHPPATPPEYLNPFPSSRISLPSAEKEKPAVLCKRSALEQAMGCFSSKRRRKLHHREQEVTSLGVGNGL